MPEKRILNIIRVVYPLLIPPLGGGHEALVAGLAAVHVAEEGVEAVGQLPLHIGAAGPQRPGGKGRGLGR